MGCRWAALLSGGFLLLGRVDPGCAWQFWWGRWLAGEAFGVGVAGGGQDLGAPGPDGGPAVVDVGGGVQAEPPVAVIVVVPEEKSSQCALGGFDRGEPGGKTLRGARSLPGL